MNGARDGLELARLRTGTTRQLTTFDLQKQSKTVRVPRGRTTTIGEVTGSGHIAQLWLTFPGWFWQHWNPEATTSPSILKTLILKLTWDGARKPAVRAPIADFFGVGLGEPANFAGRWFGMSSGGFFCKFPMPFRRGFKFEIENRDARIDTEVFANVLYQLEPELPETLGFFHTQFHCGRLRGQDAARIADVRGRGHFAGCTLSMQGEHKGYLSFLEAPEYMYVDADWKSPRIVGTGLEDYFLGGWYFRQGPFVGPLHGVPVKDALESSVSMYRVHEADAVLFQRRFKFEFQNPWEPKRLKPFAYSSVAFLYLDTPLGQGKPLPAHSRLLCFYRTRDRDRQSIP